VQAIVNEIGRIAAQDGKSDIDKRWLEDKGLQTLRDTALRVMLSTGAVVSLASHAPGGMGGGSHSREFGAGAVINATTNQTLPDDARAESGSDKEEKDGDDLQRVGRVYASTVFRDKPSVSSSGLGGNERAKGVRRRRRNGADSSEDNDVPESALKKTKVKVKRHLKFSLFAERVQAQRKRRKSPKKH